MQRLLTLTIASTLLIVISCSPAKIAIDDTGWAQKEELAVKEGKGFLLSRNFHLENSKPQL